MNYQLIITDKALNSSEKVVLIYLINRSNNMTVTDSSMNISKDIGITKPTLIKAIKSLQEKKLIVKESNENHYGGNSSNTYRLNPNKYL